MPFQATIERPVEVYGIGLHTAVKGHLRLAPAPVDSGIVFHRTDLENFAIEAHVRYNLRSRYRKRMVFYYNRSSYQAADEFQTFQDEWDLTDLRSVGPGTWPLNVQAGKNTPGAISISRSTATISYSRSSDPPSRGVSR